MGKGLIHIYCGGGKGKTTASIGLAVRAAGRGFKVLFVQFLKSADTGELRIFEQIPHITVLRGDENCTFTFKMSEETRQKCLQAHNLILYQALELCNKGQVDLLVLDEIMAAYNTDLIDKDALLHFLKNKPEALEIAMTGRDPDDVLIEVSDYVSEINKVKHPYDEGIAARTGIEK